MVPVKAVLRARVLPVLLIVVLFSAGPVSWANDGSRTEEKNPHLLEPRVRSVTVFKTGLGFFVRDGEVELRDGWCVTDKAPPAAFGTLAIYTPGEGAFVDLVGGGRGETVEFDDVDEASDEETKRRRLESVRNLRVELGYKRYGQDASTTGKILAVGAEFVVLENGDQVSAVPVRDVTRYQLLDQTLRIHVQSEKERDEPRGTARVGIAHLQKGITWIPDYTLTILDDETAELICRGTLVNEAEDLVHCEVNFVVGVPHFVHTEYMAPLAVGQMIRTLGSTLSAPAVSNAIMNRAQIVSQIPNDPVNMDAREVSADATPKDLSSMIGALPMSVGASKDYTVYTKEDLTVRKGEKALVTLFRTRIKYSHVYRWNTDSEVEHFFVLHNDTGTAWTTGPCLGIEGNQPITEDLIKYTPRGSRTELAVSTAINISTSKHEEEVERQIKAQHISSDYYLDLVTLEGRLVLHNYEKVNSKIHVTVEVPGRPIRASDDGTVWINHEKMGLSEREGTITWTIDLEPNQRKTLTYRYERYVRSG